VETSITGDVTIKDQTSALDILTYWSIPRSDGLYYSEGQGIVMTTDGIQIASWNGYGIGRHSDNGQKKFDRGSVYFRTSSTGALSFLNNLVGLFEYEVDNKRNTSGRIWEWK
jgi:hypothetical protein